MMQRVIPATLVALCTALPAAGANLSFSLGATGEYDSNVFRRDDDVKDDYIFTIRPGLRLREDHGEDLNYSLQYMVPIEFSTEFSDELNDVDQLVNADAEYRVNDRVTIGVSDRFRYLRSTLRQERDNPDDVVAGEGLPIISEERDRVTLNSGSLYLNYLMSPRWVVSGNVNSSFFDTTRDDRARNYAVGGVASTQYRWNQQHQVGGGARYTFQHFDDRDDVAGSQTHTIGIFGSWRWIYDETTTLSISAGPALLLSEQESSQSGFSAAPVPFQFVGAGFDPNFVDRNNNPVATAWGNRSLVVPSFQVINGGVQSNCRSGRTATEFITPCNLNVVFDSNDPTDAATIAAITGTPGNRVAVTNTDTSGGDSERWNIFAEVVLSKRWTPTLASAFRYSREQGNASGLGGTVVGDSVSLSTTWAFWERWQLAVRGDWIQRESVFRVAETKTVVVGVTDADIPGGTFVQQLAGFESQLNGPGTGEAFNSDRRNSIETNRWSVAGRLTHRLFRNTDLFGQVRYDQQSSDRGTLGRSSDFENILGLVGVRHTFEPIKLW